MTEKSGKLAQIKFQIDNNLPLENILFPDTSGLFGNLPEKKSSEIYHHILNSLKNDTHKLRVVRLRMLAELMFFHDSLPEWAYDWFKRELNIEDILPNISVEEIKTIKWQKVPVAVVNEDGKGSRIVTFIAGASLERKNISGLPDWTKDMLNEQAKAAVQDANSAVENSGFLKKNHSYNFFCFPLTTMHIKGPSLGLPLALGYISLGTGDKIVSGLIATGAVDKFGKISHVGRIREKAELIRQSAFQCLLYPSDDTPAPDSNNLTQIPAATLSQAWMFSSLFSPANVGKLGMLSKMMEDPSVFAANVIEVPHEWLDWIRKHDIATDVIPKVVSSPALFSVLADNLESCTDRFLLDQSDSIISLVRPYMLEETFKFSPIASLKWISSNMSLSNHRGEIAVENEWAKKAVPLINAAMKADVEAVATFYNHYLVSHHNLYHFDPALPSDLKKILDLLETLHKCRCDFGCSAYIVLGRLYGTIVQNYAFCGPEHLDSTEEYSNRARKALGENTVPEFQNEWMRQFNYITYAYIDAGRFDMAEKTLLKYLEIESWDGLESILHKLSPWRHAVLARFFANLDNHNYKNIYYKWSVDNHIPLIENYHPWQLWTQNIGRIALSLEDKKIASKFFFRSLQLCMLNNSGPTIKVMALLPLSGLLKIELSKSDIDISKQKIYNAAKVLNPQHFNILNESSFETVLRKIWETPEILFPFSYR